MNAARIELSEANDFVSKHHRHHRPVVGHRFSIGVEHDCKLVGCVIVGRPVARQSDQKHIAEVTRLCTDGTPNACSFLYAQAARAAKELGFKSIQTFILPTETGKSLKASGWKCLGGTKAGSWHTRDNRRKDQPECKKVKWEKVLRIEIENPFQTKEYQQFVESVSPCCRCKDGPCDSVLAGGICDDNLYDTFAGPNEPAGCDCD